MSKKTALALIIGTAVVASAGAEQLATTRTILQRHDLSIPGREVVQARIDFAPGVAAPPHTHPGEEIIYVLLGDIEYRVGNEPPERCTRATYSSFHGGLFTAPEA